MKLDLKNYSKTNEKYEQKLAHIMCQPNPNENAGMDVKQSRKFIRELIEDDLSPKVQKMIIQKWANKTFKYFDSTKIGIDVYPLIFFNLIFEDSEKLKPYQDIRYDYMDYIADYVDRFEPDVRKKFLEGEIQKVQGLEPIYDEFCRKLINCQQKRKQKYIITLLYILLLGTVFLLGMLFGTNLYHHDEQYMKNDSIAESSVWDDSKNESVTKSSVSEDSKSDSVEESSVSEDSEDDSVEESSILDDSQNSNISEYSDDSSEGFPSEESDNDIADDSNDVV